MGLSLSPLMGNIYMEYLKLIATGMYPLKSPIQYRYVDDMFILWSHQENKQALINCVKPMKPLRQFIMEKETEKHLFFLDGQIT